MSDSLARALAAPAPAAQPMGNQDMLARILMGTPDPGLPQYPVMQSAEGRGFAPMPTSMGEMGTRMGAVLRGQVEPTPGERYGMDVPLGWVAGSGGSARDGIRAYHGSPHQFDRFDMSRIGTGEGAQAYGHGLYFAGNEGVAQSYKQSIMRNHDELVNIAKNYGLQGDAAEMLAHQTSTGFGGQRFDSWLDGLRASIDDPLLSPRTKNAIQQILDKTPESADAYALMKAPGSMYEVRLNTTPDRLLDWDAPLSRQPQAVRDALGRIAPNASELTGREGLAAIPLPGGGVMPPPPPLPAPASGRPVGHFYPALERQAGTPAAIAEQLREAGIPGIQYLDAGSRAAGDGTRNYVMFDDKLIEILRRYGLAGMLTGGAASQAQAGEPAP